MSTEGDHDKGAVIATDAMDEAEKLLEEFSATPWKKGYMALQDECAKVVCLARHVLATELQFQSAPAFAVDELMQSASDLEGKMGACDERALSSANSARYLARANSAPAEGGKRKAGKAPHEPLLIRAANAARAQFARVEPQSPSGAHAPGGQGFASVEDRLQNPSAGKKKEASASRVPDAGETASSARENPFSAFLSTSDAAVERRKMLLTNDGARRCQNDLRLSRIQLKKDLEFKTVTDLHDMKIYHSNSAWPRTRRRLHLPAALEMPLAAARDQESGKSAVLKMSTDLYKTQRKLYELRK